MNGPNTSPVWQYLKGACANCNGDVDWNFRWAGARVGGVRQFMAKSMQVTGLLIAGPERRA